MFGGNGLSLSDIAAVTKNNGGEDGWGGNNGWWILIILFALFGWGRGGYGASDTGNGGGNAVYPIGADVQRGFDTQSILTKLDGINSGICSLGYDQLAQMNGINTNILQTGFGIQNAIQQGVVANMQNTNALQSQIQSCCCNLEGLMADAQYQRATNTCAITTAINQAAQNIINNDNANYRQLHDENVALQMEAKNQQIAALQQKLNACDTQNMITASANYVVGTLQPTPKPSYQVPNPYTGQYGAYSNCGCNNGCGNGWGFGF